METYCSEQTTELALALIEVQRQMSPATKDGKNPFIGNNYATLNSVMESCRDVLLNHGIWLTQLPVPAPLELGPGHIGLLTKLTHAESGQWQASLTVVPLPKSDPQGMGSAITYARRYALTAMLGMITEDDDGEAAKAPARNNNSQPTFNRGSNNKSMKVSGRTSQTGRNENLPDEPFIDEEELPQLDGVNYEYATTQDGRQCIIATGNTHPKKEFLRKAGFTWDATRKFWWKFANAA